MSDQPLSTAVGFDHVCFDRDDSSQTNQVSPQQFANEIPQEEQQITNKMQPYRSFNVFKDVALGTNAFSFCLQIHPSGGNAQSPSPVYHTLRIPWYKQRLYLPAPFDIYAGGTVVRSRNDPSPEPQDHRARIRYRGIEGLMGLHVTADLFHLVESTALRDDLPGSVAVSSDLVEYCSVDVVRKGIGRTYRVEIVNEGIVKTYYWKGSKAALSLFDARDGEVNASDGNGNLKFFAADRPDDVLAVWQNRTDKRILGSLGVIAELDADSDGLLEGLIVSCLAVVVAERISGRGWLGGLGKSRGS
ncbi:hypothetical protein PENANT_c025G07791 [Penicillium antarcticum]|uniref:Uncharacterized protein n=1 Tax=Penicillium antarcticum TaxID=416450 RepID=A0A1V6PYH2_9EURO|nr:uncharacterized protein N7508_000325 [Penicillium antarcticum]KAJ5320042.1 hypothetical protein N7508_000325 [Penicillium antarcticum]OQD81807.1 hypothetical protein PENANT_c025G07791 [Penicillium antarcticum]